MSKIQCQNYTWRLQSAWGSNYFWGFNDS